MLNEQIHIPPTQFEQKINKIESDETISNLNSETKTKTKTQPIKRKLNKIELDEINNIIFLETETYLKSVNALDL